jgi:hypothetical protein
MDKWFNNLKRLVDADSVTEAADVLNKRTTSHPDQCLHSSDFLALAARVCAGARQWTFCQLLAHSALVLHNFKTAEARHWTLTLFSFTAGYDLFVRQLPESRARASILAQLSEVLDTFDSAVELDVPERAIGSQYKKDFLMLITGYMDLYPAIKPRVKADLAKLAQSTFPVVADRALQARLKTLQETRGADWIPQVDAGEIGNEARYANHSDYPNGILVKRCDSACETRICGKCKTLPHLVALRRIEEGDEITINYGSMYWTHLRPGTDPLLMGKVLTTPFTDCIYYNGVVEDFAGNPSPGGFLIPPNETRRRTERNQGLTVRQVDTCHPAYPGFGLFANKSFKKGEIICIYAGIVDTGPHSGRHHSKYIVDLSLESVIGPFSFTCDPLTLLPHANQTYMPFLTSFEDVSVPIRSGEENLVKYVETINVLDLETTRTICDALSTPGLRSDLQARLSKIRTPYDNGNRRDMLEWARSVQRALKDIEIQDTPPRAQLPKYEAELKVIIS